MAVLARERCAVIQLGLVSTPATRVVGPRSFLGRRQTVMRMGLTEVEDESP
jgi:hypothetical protein